MQGERGGWVGCNTFPFLIEYLRYGRPGASDADVAAAVAAAQLSDFIARLPLGLDTKVSTHLGPAGGVHVHLLPLS